MTQDRRRACQIVPAMVLRPAMAPRLFLRDVHVTHGSEPLLDGAELAVDEGARLCVVGRNGSGKSTLLKIAAGLVEPDSGERFVQPGVTIRYLPQEPDFSGLHTLGDYARADLGPGDDPHRVTYLLNALGLTGEEGTVHVSGGEARRAALVRVLAPSPDILLLDEPTNHLDLPAIEWLEDELASMRSALVLVSHDRRFLSNLSRGTLWLDHGQTRLLNRGFAQFESWRDEVLEQEELERHKLDRKIVLEEHWLRYGVTARRKRNVRRLAGLGELRKQRRGRRRVSSLKMVASEGDLSGTLVIEATRASKAYEGKTIVEDFSIRVLRGDRIGLVGANGSGKTTLLNLLTGRLEPDSGTIAIGANVHVASLDQDRRKLLPDTTLADVLTGGHGTTITVAGKPKHVMSYMQDFLFTPEQARQPVRVLSGGERARLLLARALAAESNLLVLDEPTNDLDLETLDLLQEMIADYSGTVLLVSHDRDFLDRTVTSVLMAEGHGRFVEYAGGYTDMLAQRGSGVAAREFTQAAPRARERTASEPTRNRRKLSFNDKHALATLPDEIAKLEHQIAKIQQELADAGLYARDQKRFAALSDALTTAQKALEESEDRWIKLEILRGEIEGR
ncbi:MAG TPA: ATP-binding cassette domain-containing protein [Pirellulales bacterium]|nr:ATP-binding cassette domain-containing protein [Pirellulales bacterium]